MLKVKIPQGDFASKSDDFLTGFEAGVEAAEKAVAEAAGQEITFEWLTDRHECETCGTSYAEGAKVFIDGNLVLDLQPVAHCYGGDNYEQADVLARLLTHLGYRLPEFADTADE